MPDGMLVVSFPALQQASADIHKALNTLDAQLGQLERDAAPLVASWSGVAKESYDQRQASWRTAAQDLRQVLREIKVAVDESAADYLQTEKKNAGLFH